MNNKSSKPVLICAFGILAAFFMPWIQIFGAGMSGYNLGQLGSYGNYAWIIPILAGGTILISFSGGNNRPIGALTGIVPLGAFAYALIRMNSEGGADVTKGVLNIAQQTFSIGIYLTIIFSIAIIIAAGRPATSEPPMNREASVSGELGGGAARLAISDDPMKLPRFFETIDSYGPMVLRLGLALVLFPHGAQKVLGWWGGHGFSGTMGFFTSMLHVPTVFAFLAIMTEFLGPIALFFGFFTRLAAFAIGVQFVVAPILGGHLANGFFMNWMGNQKGEGFEYHILMVTIALGLVFLGAGKCALDTMIARMLDGSPRRA